nr:MAG TPA: hypothetical protein [Caudoviricetes sp.]
MEENKPLVTETEFPESDTDIISGDGTPIIDTSDQNVDTAQEETNTSKPDAEESTENSNTNTEENGAGENTTTEIVTDPANDPATLESALLVSTYAALNKLAEYVPTEYVNNSEPDLDAEHLNNTEQGLLRVTNLLNGAVDVINDLQTTVAQQASAIETLNSNLNHICDGRYTRFYRFYNVDNLTFEVPLINDSGIAIIANANQSIFAIIAVTHIAVQIRQLYGSGVTYSQNGNIITLTNPNGKWWGVTQVFVN